MKNGDTGRVRDDDDLIDLVETLKIMGGIGISTAYEDPALMRLKIKMTSPERRTRMVRFIRREILELRAQRIERAEADGIIYQEKTEARLEARRVRQRIKA